eukprot:UN06248
MYVSLHDIHWSGNLHKIFVPFICSFRSFANFTNINSRDVWDSA